MREGWKLTPKLILLDLSTYIEKRNSTSRTSSFTVRSDRVMVVKMENVYFPLTLHKEMIIPHPFIRDFEVRMYLAPCLPINRILQIYIGFAPPQRRLRVISSQDPV